MEHNVRWIWPGETVAGAARLMASQNMGLLPIRSPDGKPIGVLTERDIVLRVIGTDRLAHQTLVGDVMSAPVHSVGPDFPVERVGKLMAEAGVSRILVIDESGHLKGLVSMAELMVHAPWHHVLVAVRAVYVREGGDRSFA